MVNVKTLLILFVCLNGAAAAMQASGANAWLGIQPQPGVDDEADQITQGFNENDLTRDSASGDFSGGNVRAIQIISNAASYLTAFPRLMQNLGLPGWAALFIAQPLVIILAYGVLKLIPGVG